jgi:hypothetical protein
MKLFDKKYGTLEYDEFVPCIIITASGFMSSEQFRNMLDIGLDHFVEKKRNHTRLFWIADTSKHVVRPDEDTRWVVENWNPRAMAAGVGHIAFVAPENVFGGRAVKKYADDTEKNSNDIVINMFGDLQSAKDWCKSL